MRKIAVFVFLSISGAFFALFLPLSASAQTGQTPSAKTAQTPRYHAPAHPTKQEKAAMAEQYDKLSEFYKLLTTNYLDTMSYSKIVERGIRSMLAELDPHSIYLSAKEQASAKEGLSGRFSGIGVEYNTLNDTIVVTGTVPGTPADKAGLKPDDRIIAIDHQSVIGVKRADVPEYVRGPRGSKVAITVFRRGELNPLEFTVIRQNVPIFTIDAAYRIDSCTGYIKVNRFGSTTAKEFADAFAALGKGIDGLILDLRGNGGGYMPQALAMAEFFLEKWQTIVSTEGNLAPTRIYTASRAGKFAKGRLIVLVDERSASASEIVAGAVQDWDRGIVVGRPTFGKGLVQREFALRDGSALRITISRYLTPTGRAIQRPYELGHSREYFAEQAHRYGDLALDTLGETSGAVYKTLRTGREMYGGGGIRPDVLVAADTTGHSKYWATITGRGLTADFIQTYLDSHRARLTAEYPSVEQYLAGFDAAALLHSMAEYAAAHGVERDERGLATSQGWLAAELKALIARRLWDSSAYFRVFNADLDATFARAAGMMARWKADGLHGGALDGPVSDSLVRTIAK